MDKDYTEAWDEEGEAEAKKKANPITESVKAARKADEDEFVEAYKTDNFGIDVQAVAKKDGENGEEMK